MINKRCEVLLGSGNYFHWEYNMRMTLARKGLLVHVLVIKKEEEMTDAWLFNDAKALGIIAQGIELQHQTKIRSATTAMHALVILRDFYNRTTLHNRVEMTRRLHEFKMENGSTTSKHLDAFYELVVGLQTLAETVDDSRQLVVLLCSHPTDQVGHYKRDCLKRSNSEEEGAVFAAGELRCEEWLIDSGATSHMTPHRSELFEYKELNTGQQVSIADEKKLQGVGVETVNLKGLDGRRTMMVEVMHIPGLDKRLLSVGKLAGRGMRVEFRSSSSII
uniref:Retrovirus-related Pol polyprotein from transposon TNT 1-94-like beta-barrel domain-containing protein n=1 Tax=Peronospora matthiolae TaxID=2874970 RepID=A0AAV1TEL6_9STRA